MKKLNDRDCPACKQLTRLYREPLSPFQNRLTNSAQPIRIQPATVRNTHPIFIDESRKI
jgi:hypothetical protein